MAIEKCPKCQYLWILNIFDKPGCSRICPGRPKPFDDGTIIHKRCFDTRLLGDHTWQLCDPNISFKRPEYYHGREPFTTWCKTAKHQWVYVNCPACLKLRQY